MKSPVGLLHITENDGAITTLEFCDPPPAVFKDIFDSPLLQEARQQLNAYFDKRLTVFDLPLQPAGTAFQRQIWNQLIMVPFGKTTSYLALSRQLGNEKALRAVGVANGRNPIPIIIPCHRIIGSDGRLVGYSGGLWRKEWLLAHEGKSIQRSLSF